MTIFRENPYVIIDRKIFKDPKISWGAKGLYAYICTLNPKEPLPQETALIKELIDAGYLEVSNEH